MVPSDSEAEAVNVLGLSYEPLPSTAALDTMLWARRETEGSIHGSAQIFVIYYKVSHRFLRLESYPLLIWMSSDLTTKEQMLLRYSSFFVFLILFCQFPLVGICRPQLVAITSSKVVSEFGDHIHRSG